MAGADLHGRVALVTGATRGAGRAVALVLAEAGATVVVTGRSSLAQPAPEGLGGTVEETAAEVTRRGGTGVPCRCDHSQADQVATLAQHVEQHCGRLDLVVSNAWGGYEQHDPATFTSPFWQQPEASWHGMVEVGVRGHWLLARALAPWWLRQGQGLFVATVAWAYGAYLGNALYDAAKAATIRLTAGLGHDLAPHGVTALALAPGFMRTERVMAAHAAAPFDLTPTESPTYLGRAILALATDREVSRWNSRTLTVGYLAQCYGFTDEDGRQPPSFRLPPGYADMARWADDA